MSDIREAVFSVIVEEHGFSRAKYDYCNLHALHRHEERDVYDVLLDKTFQLYKVIGKLESPFLLIL